MLTLACGGSYTGGLHFICHGQIGKNVVERPNQMSTTKSKYHLLKKIFSDILEVKSREN
jgi:hypothetical protein